MTRRRRVFKLGRVSRKTLAVGALSFAARGSMIASGMLIARLRSSIARHQAPHATTVVVLACTLWLTAAGCLTDTPPKTPNQRDAERNAPVVAVPPPPDAGRTPRPALQ